MTRARTGDDGAAAVGEGAARREEDLVVASHDALFVAPAEARCDACGASLPPADDDEGYGLPGNGVYVWTRGDEVRFEKAPLCTSCASAIGMTALARWEIEEEEG
ncbi:MAG TPA: hypothetical protein VIF15_07655 [Polyangiaceae bacterium]|jgi:hypothetical protein